MIVGGIPMLFTALTAVPVDISLTDNAVITTDLTTYTFAAKALGVAESTRRIAVGITSRSTPTGGVTINSVTIGGVSASQVVVALDDQGGTSSNISAIWMAAVPTGATGDVVVTLSAAALNCGIDVYRLLNASATAYHTATDIVVTSNALDASLNLIANGAAIAVFCARGTLSTARTTTWTNLTEQTDRVLEAAFAASTAANTTTTTQTLTITATASGDIDRYALALASFQPV